MAEPVPYKYYRYSVNGTPYVEAGVNVASGGTEIGYDDFISSAKSQYSDNSYGAGVSYYDYMAKQKPGALEGPTALQQGSNTPYSTYTNPTTGATDYALNTSLDEMERMKNDPNLTETSPGLYVSKTPATPSADWTTTTPPKIGGALESSYEQGFNNAQATGMSGTPAQATNANNGVYKVGNDVFMADGTPIDLATFKSMGLNIDHINTKDQVQGLTSSQARGVIEQYTPTEKPSNPLVDAFFQEDPFMQGLVKSFQDYISPANQRKSLTETYQQMVKDSGIEALDTEMINMKNIIEGSEDDIRREITASGGFSTESQVLALVGSRNKQLIKNYNTLLETRNAKEKYLSTMIGLEQQDRQEADQRFEQSFNMAMQIADYGQKMKQNALEAFERTKEAIGWTGILESVQGDPTAIRLIEKSYGLPAGGLAIAARQEAEAAAQAQKQQAFENKLALSKMSLDEQKFGLETYKVMQDEGDSTRKYVDANGDIIEIGSKQLSAGQANLLSEGAQLSFVLDPLYKILEDNESLFGPIRGRIGQANPYDTASQTIDDDLRRASQVIGKYMEGGVLRKEDEEKYRRMLPQLTDTPEVAQNKLDGVATLLAQKQQDYIDSYAKAGYDISKFLSGDSGGDDPGGLYNNSNDPGGLFNSEGGVSINAIAEAIAMGESRGSGGYAAIGPATSSGDKAYGKYQIMGTNIGPWSQQILGRKVTISEFMSNPQIQDAIAQGMMQQYYDKYGSADAVATAWFAGPGAVGTNSQAKDVLGTSVPVYLQRFRDNLSSLA